MDQKCNIKVKAEQWRKKKNSSFAKLASEFIKEFLIRRVSIITFRYELFLHRFYICLKWEKGILIVNYAMNYGCMTSLKILGYPNFKYKTNNM